MEKALQRKLKMMRLGIQLIIALLLSLVMTAINYGFKGDFFYNWVKAFAVAFIIQPRTQRFATAQAS